MKQIALIFFGVFWLFGTSAMTQEETSMKLDGLLDRLSVTADQSEAELLAEEVWARFFDSGSPSIDLMLQRGIAAQAEGNLDLASDFFADVVELEPDFAEGWNRRAALEYAHEEYAAALEDLGVTLQLQPRHFGALTGLGLVLERLGSVEGAYQAYQDALDIYPFLPQALDGVSRLEKKVKGRQL